MAPPVNVQPLDSRSGVQQLPRPGGVVHSEYDPPVDTTRKKVRGGIEATITKIAERASRVACETQQSYLILFLIYLRLKRW